MGLAGTVDAMRLTPTKTPHIALTIAAFCTYNSLLLTCTQSLSTVSVTFWAFATGFSTHSRVATSWGDARCSLCHGGAVLTARRPCVSRERGALQAGKCWDRRTAAAAHGHPWIKVAMIPNSNLRVPCNHATCASKRGHPSCGPMTYVHAECKIGATAACSYAPCPSQQVPDAWRALNRTCFQGTSHGAREPQLNWLVHALSSSLPAGAGQRISSCHHAQSNFERGCKQLSNC